MANAVIKRGTLIVFEGCDRSGKTTVCKKLVEHFNGKESVFNSEMNSVKFIDKDNLEDWGYMSKDDVADKICLKISKFFNEAA